MAITHTETVHKMTVLNDGMDIVSHIDVEIFSVDDSDPVKLKQTSHVIADVDTSGGTSAAGFVPDGSLTEDAVKSWLSTEIAERKTQAEEWINLVKNPPAPPEVSKNLPWN